MSDLKTIADFLAQRRIALVGLSSNPADFSHALADELERHGMEILGVHPGLQLIGERHVYEHVTDISPRPDGVLIMTPPEATLSVVMDCVEAHVPRVWFYRGVGQGAVQPEAVKVARAAGIKVVDGECPLMFLNDAGFVHRAHGFLRKCTGHYPEERPVGAFKPVALRRH